MLPVYLFALSLANARLACLFATTLPLDVILVECAVLHFSFYFFDTFLLFLFVFGHFLLLPSAFFAGAPRCPIRNLLSLSRLLVIVTIEAVLGGVHCDRRYWIDTWEATWLGRDARKRIALHHLVFDVIYYFHGRRRGTIAREGRQVIVHLFVVLHKR